MKKLILFGASKAAKEFLNFITKKEIIYSFCDNDKSKWGEDFCGIKIISPEELVNHQDKEIVITSCYYEEIKKQLNDMNIVNFRYCEEYIHDSIYEFIENNRYGYIATHPEKLKIGMNVKFNQKTVFISNGKIIIGNNVEFGYRYGIHYFGFHELVELIDEESIIEIGNGTTFNNDCILRCLKKIKFGKNCLVGDRVTIMDFDAHDINPTIRRESAGKSKEVIIGENVWIGSKSIILKGVTIGNNSIIGAGSVVTKSIPENTIVAGNPATIVRAIKTER